MMVRAPTRVYVRPHPEERALARVSKDGRERAPRIHPSRRPRKTARPPQDEVGIFSQPLGMRPKCFHDRKTGARKQGRLVMEAWP
jgi:hypothetical protein